VRIGFPGKSLAGWQRLCWAALAALLLLAQVGQPFPETAWLHHLPTLALLIAAPFLLRRWAMSTAAVACVAAFFALHTIGGHWTYTEVPYDAAAQALFGTSISDLFGFSRNHYDRIVHFAYGLLIVLPAEEALERHLRVSPRLARYIAFESVLAASALYEMFEWALTLAAAGATADAYNGQQGDMWDAQKDMALAAFGAALMLGADWWRRRCRGG
jgi:putative membrane protein